MKRVVIRMKPATYLKLFIAIVVMFIVAQSLISAADRSTLKEIERMDAQNTLLNRQLNDLQDKLAFIKTNEGIELYARANGMCMPGEVHYNVN